MEPALLQEGEDVVFQFEDFFFFFHKKTFLSGTPKRRRQNLPFEPLRVPHIQL